MTPNAQRICDMIAALLMVDAAQVTPGARLVDLGLDSLDMITLALDLESQFRIELGEGEIEALLTVADAIALVDRHLAKRGAA